MDKFDRQIIEALTQNARQPVANIAEQVNLSRSAVSERIRKMESTGVIKGYQVQLDKPEASNIITVFFEVFRFNTKCDQIIPEIRKIPEIKLCYGISGETDLLIYVQAANINEINHIRQKIETMEQVTKVKTHVVMHEWINRM